VGWCQEFAQQIRPGCDHLMLAGVASCSCEECGTVCPGRFRGCASVWAAGPQPVTLRGPAPAAAANGNGTYGGAEHLAAVATPSAPDWGPEIRADLAALQTQMEELSLRVDGATASKTVSDDALLKMARASETLPERIGKSLTAALREHNDVVLSELEVFNSKLSARIDGVAGTLGTAGTRPAADEGRFLREIDARFEWLVAALSERLVVIGNEVARMQMQLDLLASAEPAESSEPAEPAHNGPAPTRIEPLRGSATLRASGH
jgi:hypothetical protein